MNPKSYRFLNLGLDIRALRALNIEGEGERVERQMYDFSLLKDVSEVKGGDADHPQTPMPYMSVG